MVDDGNGNIDFSGFGIYAEGSSDLDLTLSKNNNFTDVTQGVVGIGYGSANIIASAYDNIGIDNELGADDNHGVGVKLIGCVDSDISLNTFVDCETAIHVDGSTGNTEIHRNAIEQSSTNTYSNGLGIHIAGGGQLTDIHRHHEQGIEDDVDAYIKDMRFGVYLDVATNVVVRKNDIHVNDIGSENSVGIGSWMSQGEIYENQIYFSSGSNTDGDYGIHPVFSPSMAINCNEIQEATVGIYRMFEFGPAEIIKNEFGGDQLASIWNVTSAFPQQGTPTAPADNKWLDGSTFNYHTYNEDPTSLPDQIYVRPLPVPPSSDDYEYRPNPFVF